MALWNLYTEQFNYERNDRLLVSDNITVIKAVARIFAVELTFSYPTPFARFSFFFPLFFLVISRSDKSSLRFQG